MTKQFNEAFRYVQNKNDGEPANNKILAQPANIEMIERPAVEPQ